MTGLSNGNVDREAATKFLLNLSLRERVELFNEVLQQFQELELAENGNVLYKTVYLVADLTYSNLKNELRPGPADVLALALPAIEDGGYISDTVNQDGACKFCGTVLSGFCKHSICPACGSIVEMT